MAHQGPLSLSQEPSAVRRINLGFGNKWLQTCLERNVLAFGVSQRAYELYVAGDLAGLVEYYMGLISPFTEELNRREVASRYANEIKFFCETGDEILWLVKGATYLHWCRAEKGARIESEYIENNPNRLEDRRAHLMVRPIKGEWKNQSLNGRSLELWKLHPKARDWLTQRGTMGRLQHADYFIALIEDEDLVSWHSLPEMKASLIKGWNTEIPNVPPEWGFEVGRLAASIMNVVANANGQVVERISKIKNSSLSESEWHVELRKRLLAQNFRCNITGRDLTVSKGSTDPWLQPSVDRINSDGDYEPSNIQIVSWAANRAKGDLSPDKVESYFQALQLAVSSPEPGAN